MLSHFPNPGQLTRGLALVICLCFWMGGTKVQAGCGDHVLLNGPVSAQKDSSPEHPIKHKRCSGFWCTNSTPLAPVAPSLAPERMMEKPVLITRYQEQPQQIFFVSFADHCELLQSSGHPGDILDPPRS